MVKHACFILERLFWCTWCRSIGTDWVGWRCEIGCDVLFGMIQLVNLRQVHQSHAVLAQRHQKVDVPRLFVGLDQFDPTLAFGERHLQPGFRQQLRKVDDLITIFCRRVYKRRNLVESVIEWDAVQGVHVHCYETDFPHVA